MPDRPAGFPGEFAATFKAFLDQVVSPDDEVDE